MMWKYPAAWLPMALIRITNGSVQWVGGVYRGIERHTIWYSPGPGNRRKKVQMKKLR